MQNSLYSLEDYERPLLDPPNKEKNILLHSCCAPCACEIIEALVASDITPIIFFYNPNIHPRNEYEIRKEENIRFAEQLNLKFIDVDYDTDSWFERIKGLEYEPERGERCTQCFDMRFERTALYAYEHDFKLISSTLAISRWKDMKQINDCGERAAQRYNDIIYWTINWRKKGGSQRMIEISKNENFYQQEYCGCIYSLRDTNRWRLKNSRPTIKRGEKFYGKESLQ